MCRRGLLAATVPSPASLEGGWWQPWCEYSHSPMSHDAICAWLNLQKVGFTACTCNSMRNWKEDAKGAAAHVQQHLCDLERRREGSGCSALTQLPLVGPESGVAAGAGGGAGGGGGVPLGA